jgi:hypothetical protein
MRLLKSGSGLRLLCLSCLALGAALCAATEGQAFSGSSHWCGYDQVNDWVCRFKGAVFKNDELLPKQGRRKAESGSKITTGPNSLARLALKNEAHCVIGGANPSELLTRTGLNGALLTQKAGSSSCTMPKTGQPLRIMCGLGERCPVELRIKGTVLIAVSVPSTASASTTEVTETFHQRGRIVLCTGSLRVRAETETGFSEAAGSASGRSRFIVIVELTITKHEENGSVSKDESVSVNVAGQPAGAGGCNASTVQEERESVREERTTEG